MDTGTWLILGGLSLGEGACKLVDLVAPAYTIAIAALVTSSYIKRQAGTKHAVVPPPVREMGRASSKRADARSSAAALPPLEEATTGITLPGQLDFPGADGKPLLMCGLGCGPRLKKIGPLNVKVYAIGLYVEAGAAKALEPFKSDSSSPALFEALFDQEKFFVRKVLLTFARGVSSKQVTDAIAENLKAHLDEKILEKFGTTLASGIGKSLDKGESIFFAWTAPESLVIGVRGKATGELSHPKLPYILFRGFLGPNTPIPPLRSSTAQGLPRLFQAAAGAMGAGGEGGGGGRSAPASAPAVPATVTEPSTGLPLPTTLTMVDPTSADGAGLGMSLLGCGVRVKKLGMISVNVYALGIFVDAERSKPHLEAFKSGTADPRLFEALLSREAFFSRMLYMVFARSVSAKQVADALAEKLKPNLPPEVFDQFNSTVINSLGKGLSKGQTLAFLWAAPDHLSVIVNGKPSGEITNDRLPRMLHVGFLGDDPGVPEAKAAIPKAVADLLSR
uniref:Chalcone-flavonone isomerase family protein n=1 Tax=Rhizochromulina marina TaxID=1034831 RepID=A0A7S2S0W0_9STRA